MLKKTQRLSTNRISWLLKKGFKFNNDWFSVKFLLNKEANNRYSIVVSKKIAALATDRNLIRRQTAEILRTFTEHPPAADYVLVIKSKFAELPFLEKQSILQELLQQISSKLN